MTQDDIVVMAVNAGANAHFVKHHMGFVETFAKLVAAKVRKETLEEMIYAHPTAAIKQAVEYEREACLKICEAQASTNYWEGADVCAEAIRARGEA